MQREPERSRRGKISAGTDGQEPPHGRTGVNFFLPLVHLESTGAGGHEREPERPDLSEPGDPGSQDEVRAGGERDEPRPRRDEIRGGHVRGEGHQVQ